VEKVLKFLDWLKYILHTQKKLLVNPGGQLSYWVRTYISRENNYRHFNWMKWNQKVLGVEKYPEVLESNIP